MAKNHFFAVELRVIGDDSVIELPDYVEPLSECIARGTVEVNRSRSWTEPEEHVKTAFSGLRFSRPGGNERHRHDR